MSSSRAAVGEQGGRKAARFEHVQQAGARGRASGPTSMVGGREGGRSRSRRRRPSQPTPCRHKLRGRSSSSAQRISLLGQVGQGPVDCRLALGSVVQAQRVLVERRAGLIAARARERVAPHAVVVLSLHRYTEALLCKASLRCRLEGEEAPDLLERPQEGESDKESGEARWQASAGMTGRALGRRKDVRGRTYLIMLSGPRSSTSWSKCAKRTSWKLSMTARSLAGSYAVRSARNVDSRRSYLPRPASISSCDSGSARRASRGQGRFSTAARAMVGLGGGTNGSRRTRRPYAWPGRGTGGRSAREGESEVSLRSNETRRGRSAWPGSVSVDRGRAPGVGSCTSEAAERRRPDGAPTRWPDRRGTPQERNSGVASAAVSTSSAGQA